MHVEEYVQHTATCGISFYHLWIVFFIDLFMMATSFICGTYVKCFATILLPPS